MREQYYYANFPTKLHHQKFKSKKDRNLHLLAMSIIVGWVHTNNGRFFLSARKLSEELDCSIKKAKEILDNFINWGYIKKIAEARNQHQQTIFELSTYNWNLETAKETATETAHSKEYQQPEQNQETAKETATETQTNNELTNNEKTNNEINNKKNLSQPNSNIDDNVEQIANEVMSENICLTIEDLEREFQLIRGMYEKKTGNYKNQRDKYLTLRLKHHVPFETIKDAIENYIAEMHTEEIDLKYWKNLENLLTTEELRPFMYVPVKAQTREGLWVEGEFCQLLNVIKYRLPDGTTGRKVLSREELTRLFEENRIEFLDFYEDYIPISVYRKEALTDA